MGPRSNKKGTFASSVKASKLERRKAVLTPGKSVLIVCEDSKASPDYFERFRKKLRLSTVNVEVCGEECGSDPKSVVDYTKGRKQSEETSTRIDEYDNIFCVVDVDEHSSLGDAVQTARDNNICLVISNPCFEYWYILHFEKTGSSYNSRTELYRKLTKHLKQQYDKSSCDFFDFIYPATQTAIRNSKEILSGQWHNEPDLRQCNPSTHVHRVVECIMDIAAKSRPL